MTDLRQLLETNLAEIPAVTLQLYKETTLLTVQAHGKEIAHFHDEPLELDLRIPKKFAKRHGLGEPHLSPKHPDRSKNSIWRSFPCSNRSDAEEIARLVNTLINEEYTS